MDLFKVFPHAVRTRAEDLQVGDVCVIVVYEGTLAVHEIATEADIERVNNIAFSVEQQKTYDMYLIARKPPVRPTNNFAVVRRTIPATLIRHRFDNDRIVESTPEKVEDFVLFLNSGYRYSEDPTYPGWVSVKAFFTAQASHSSAKGIRWETLTENPVCKIEVLYSGVFDPTFESYF